MNILDSASSLVNGIAAPASTITVSINDRPLPFNPTDITFNSTQRTNTEFISINNSSSTRYVSPSGDSSGGGHIMKDTVTFTLFQYPKMPLSSTYDPTDYIEMLRKAGRDQEPIKFEVTESITRNWKGRHNIIAKSSDRYLVADVSASMVAKSGFRESARITLVKYVPAVHAAGMLKIGTKNGSGGKIDDITMTFVKSEEREKEQEQGEHVAYTGECGLSWLYDMFVQDVPAGDDPAMCYPPHSYTQAYYYGVHPVRGVEIAERGYVPGGGQLEETETWSESLRRYAGNIRDFTIALDETVQKFDTTLETAGSYVLPYISTSARIAAGIATGGWSEIAVAAISHYSWSAQFVSGIKNHYNAVQKAMALKQKSST